MKYWYANFLSNVSCTKHLISRHLAICNSSMVFIWCDLSAVDLGILQVRMYPKMSLVWKQAEPVRYMQMYA